MSDVDLWSALLSRCEHLTEIAAAAAPFFAEHMREELILHRWGYTDGLIERRHQDIDTGLSRLTDALARHRALTHPEALADAVINDLIPAEGVTDDSALVVVSL
uniref:SpoIIE family protein phosphatase n=1 Tax=Streptomyces albidocamelliae TaxID=2981135 RepID=UPI00384E256F